MIVECKHCGEPFKYVEKGGGWGDRVAEDIDCPHCGKVHGRQVTAGFFESAALSPEEKQMYLAQKARSK